MNLHIDAKLPKAVPNDILRPYLNLDLIIGIDYYLSGSLDVRRALILDIHSDRLVLQQPERPLPKSRMDQTLEATFVYHDLMRNETCRLGWPARILEFEDDYRLYQLDLKALETQAVHVSKPPPEGLSAANIRRAYRFDNGLNSGIELKLSGGDSAARLENFSRSGLLISAGTPSLFQIGQMLELKLIFPKAFEYRRTEISGLGMIVRLERRPDEFQVKAGLNFVDLSAQDSRGLDNIIKCHMLAEQRSRIRLTNN